MQIQENPFLTWQIISALLTLGIFIYIQTRPRKKRESSALALMMFGGAVWSMANIVQWISPDITWQTRWDTLVFIGILIVPTAWFLFAIRYTGIGLKLFDKFTLGLWVIPSLTYLAIITNDIHHLFHLSQKTVLINGFTVLESDYGPLFYIHTGYSYLVLLSGMGILGYSLFANFKKYGIHAYGLLIGVITPLAGNIYFLFSSKSNWIPDPTPFFFGITGIAFTWALFGSKMLEVVDIARDSIIHNLSNGIVVLDIDNNILDINPAAVDILGTSEKEFIDRPFIHLIKHNSELAEIITSGLDRVNSGEFHSSVQWTEEQRSFEAVFTQIKDNLGQMSGCLIEFWDISEKILAEENLASTRAAYESTMDALLDNYFEADQTGRITYANKAFITNLGFSDKQEVIGKHFRNFTDRKALREIFNKFKILYETRQPLEPFEYHYRTKDGTIYIGETLVSPIMRGDEIVGARGIIRDVTDRVMAKREIAAQKDFLDGILQNAPFAIVINDMENRITVTNPAFETIFGYSPEEVTGKTLVDLLSTPDSIDEMKSLSKVTMVREVFHTGQRRKKDGKLVDVDISSVPFYLNEEKFGNLVFYQDITDRLKIESELTRTQITTAEILESLQDPYFEADTLGRITFSNSAFARAIGYENKAEIIGKNFRHITERKYVREVFENFHLLYETGKPIDPFEYHYRRKDGEVFIAEIVASPMIEDGKVVGSRGIVRDISVRIKAEEVLREAKEAAEYRAGELAAINRLAEKVGQTLDLQEILDSACQELAAIFKVKNVGIGLVNNETGNFEIVAYHSNIPGEETAQGVLIPIQGNTYLKEMEDDKKTIVIQDAQTDPRMKASNELFRDRGTKAIMLVPLLIRGKVIGNIGLPALDPDHRFSEDEIELAETIGSQISSAIDNAQLYAQTETALGAAESDLEIGSQIQSGFFPNSMPAMPGWEIATHFHSARQVAGDFYDIFQFKDSDLTALVIADVCDKGVGAALFMVLFRSLLRAFSDEPIDNTNVQARLLEIIQSTNNYIAQIHGQSNMFATVFFGILDPESGVLHYINGGHEPPVIMDKNGEIINSLMPTGPAVGLLPDMEFVVEKTELDRGDILVGFTDGATDARNKAGELFTEDRLIDTIKAPWTSIFSMIFELEVELKNHIGGQDQFDDITLISLRRKITEGIDFHAVCRPAEINMLGELREFIEEAAVHSGLPSEDVFAFKLSAEEILTNIIQYGYPDQDPGLLALSFECGQEKAVMKIWDDGVHFPLGQAPAPDIESGWEERKLGGLGIYFVRELMDNVSYQKEENNTNLIVLEKGWGK
jgi:PAS domain S-box-containing protein